MPPTEADVLLHRGQVVGSCVGQHDTTVVGDQDGPGVHVAVRHVGRVRGGDSAGHGVRDRSRTTRVQWTVGDKLAQRRTVDPLPDHVCPGLLVDRVVHID